MSTLRVELRDILWLIDHLLNETPCDQSLLIAYTLWRKVRSSLEGLLVGIGESMEAAARRDPDDDDPEEPEPSLPAQHVRCSVCMDRLPTVGLRPCGHTLCAQCAYRLFRCPLCRAVIHGGLPLFVS
ncbi:baculoviral IAP repeat-containing protein 7-like [Homalodisca vitripennis]|uniref:baculoviral IAP repeat-containing protein 7-like n=1 Tax=Homalodisca vitripennis TaxID=197043 RepID=UPI001EEBADCF|nr:baculoviral IAP repeat-containing protein 7-like [Homalodisca vitripennis]